MALTVREFMSSPAITTTPDATAEQVAQLMLSHVIGGLPVMDDDRLIGIVTFTDLRNVDEGVSVEQIMSRDVMTIGPEEGLLDAATILSDHNIRRLPVVDEEGTVIGIVSRANIVKAVASKDIGRSIMDELRAAKRDRKRRGKGPMAARRARKTN